MESDLLVAALKRKATLPSWRAVFAHLTSSPAVISPILSDYLLSSQLVALTRCYAPYPPPSQASKQDFESKTASIHFESADQLGLLPPIEELKQEVLELSTSLNIEELLALRVVILEYQTRENVALLKASPASTENQNGGFFEFDSSNKNAGAVENQEDKKERVLRQRIAVYLQERRYVIKSATYLVRASFTKGNAWKEVGKRVVSAMKVGDSDTLKDIIKAIGSRMIDGDADAPQWVKDKMIENTAEGREVLHEWEKQLLIETIHLLQLLFLMCYRPMEVTGTVAARWFKLMDDTSFFSQVKPPVLLQLADIQNLKSYLEPLCSLISLTVLSLDKVDDYLVSLITNENLAPQTSNVVFEDNSFYLKSSNAMTEITHVLALHARNPVASLAALGWSMVLKRIVEFLHVFNIDTQDLDSPAPEPQALATPVRRRKTGHPGADLYISTLSKIYARSPQGKSTSSFLAKSAIECGVFEVLVTLVINVGTEGNGGIAWSLNNEEDGRKMKAVLATFIRRVTEIVEWGKALVGSSLVLNEVPMSEAWEITHSLQSLLALGEEDDTPVVTSMNKVVDKWWSDQEALPRLLLPAKARFPYEPLPFLKIVRSLATNVSHTCKLLSNMDTYTQVLPVGFSGYELLDNGYRTSIGNGNGSTTSSVDDIDSSLIVLVEELCLFAPRMVPCYEAGEDEVGGGGITLPPGTRGRVISDNRTAPPIVMWYYPYNGLTFLGRVLECALIGSAGGGSGTALTRRGSKITDELGNKEAVAEIIAIYTSMILATALITNGNTAERVDHVASILQESSDALAKNRDIVSMIFDLLEDELMTCSRGVSAEYNTDYITMGLHLVDSLIPVLPDRVWPYLARSSLLEQGAKEGTLMRITNGIEVVKGEYAFTCTALRLFQDLVEDGIRGIVAKSGVLGGVNHMAVLNTRAGTGTGVSSKVQKATLAEWTHWGIDLFESYRGWKYCNPSERMEIGQRIADILSTILEAVYGVDDSSDLNNKVTGILAPAAEHLVKVFLSHASTALPIQPIVGAIKDGEITPESSLYIKPMESWVASVAATMKFAATLVRVRAYLGLPPSQLEHDLFDIAPSIAKIYAVHERFKFPAVDLLEAMISAAGSSHSVATDFTSHNTQASEPPSLLGHLGTECANVFAQVLSRLDSPVHDFQLETGIWNLISAIVSNKQQGMSILLLRGEISVGPFGVNKNKVTTTCTNGEKNNGSILAVALDELSDLTMIENQPERALPMLEAVALSQNYWSLAMDDLGRHPEFLATVVKFIKPFNVEFSPSDKGFLITKCNKIAVVAYMAQILGMHIHTKRSSSSRHEPGFISQLLDPNTLKYYFQHGVQITGYRSSLHSHLGKNFEDKWPGLGLMKLKKTRLKKKVYGSNYFYDLELAGQLLGFDRFWADNGAWKTKLISAPGKSNAVASGYKEEVEQANLNLSLIDSQVVLMRAWRILAMELCPFATQNSELFRSLLKVVETCLAANSEVGQIPAPITNIIHADRADFAFVILRKLSQIPARPDTGAIYEGVLKAAWKAILSEKQEFHKAFSTGENIAYYRSLLRIIYMSLLAQQSSTEAVPVQVCYVILDMLDLVVTQGFKDLAQAAQSQPEVTNPEDLALVTAILQASLRVKGIEAIHSGLGMHVGEQNTIRAATTLYSWAEQIGTTENGFNDPVYGELAVLFLLELSYIPLLAEQLAVERVLDLLLTSNLSRTISSVMTGGLNNPLQYPRLHNIWSRGLLPILINLLSAIGPRIGSDVVQFLSFFGRQIESLVDSWKQRGSAITLPGVRETSTLVGILEILRSWGVNVPSPTGKLKQLQLSNGNEGDTEMTASVSPLSGGNREETNIFGTEPSICIINGIRFDKGAVLEGVEYLLNHRNYLASLVVPTTFEEEENAIVDKTGDKAGVSKLVEKVINEMDTLRKLLTVVIGEDAEKV